jgi:hypothetical protein
MAYLAKIRALPRGSASGDVSVMKGRGVRVPSGLGPYFPAGVKASLTPTANSVTFTALYGGTWGNSLRVQTIVGTLAIGAPSAINATTGFPDFTVTAPATATLAANQAIVAAVNSDPFMSQYIVASIAGTGAAANGAVAMTALSGGTNSGTGQTFWVRASGVAGNAGTAIVDLDNTLTARQLRRQNSAFVVVGAGKYLDA